MKWINNIEIFNQVNKDIEELKDVERVIDIAIKNQKLDNLEFNIIIVDNEYIHKLNRDYRGIDRPTDVISFAFEDNNDLVYNGIRMLGDIFICIPQMKRQAESYSHSEKRELSFLAVHGLLHLLGYDHIEKEDEEVMFKKQDELLNKTIYRRK